MRADRFGQRALQSGLGSALQKYLTHCVRAQPGCLDHASTIDLAEQRTDGNFGQCQPILQSCDRAGLIGLATWDGDLGTFSLGVGLGALDQ